METHSHADIAAIEHKNWWYATRRDLIGSLLRRYAPKSAVALDVGCGVGSNYAILAERAQKVIGLDISQDALDHVRVPYDEKVLASVEEMPLPDSSIDIILCADVLEHVDDVKAVKEMWRILNPNGRVIVTVPAFESLWNENDDYGHHLRRYRKTRLAYLFTHNGFSIQYLYYWNRIFFLPVWLVARTYTRGQKKEGLRNNLSAIPGWLDPLLIMWMRIENALARVIPLPFGVSLVVIAEKSTV